MSGPCRRPLQWVCWWGCCVPVCVALLRVWPRALDSDSASGPGSGPAAASMCASGRLSGVDAPWQDLWVTVSSRCILSPVHFICAFRARRSQVFRCPSLHPPFLQTWFQMHASRRSSQGTRKHYRGVDMRQMETNNAGDGQASAGPQCWLRFKSLLPANWE